MNSLIKNYGSLFPFDLPFFIAFILGMVYMFAFFGAVYYGIDLCKKLEDSSIGKFVKIILVLTPLSFIFYPSLLQIYPEKIITINATVGVLEILSLLYLMIWQTLYIIIELLFRSMIFLIRILVYMVIILLGLYLVQPETLNENYVILVAIGYRLFEIRTNLSENFIRIYGNLIFNLRCVFSF